MHFRMWLENEYDAFRPKVNSITRDFPFFHWFNPTQREYIPLNNVGAIHNENYKDIADLLKDFTGGSNGFPVAPQGYIIADYKMGFAKPNGSVRPNLYKISKILYLILQQEIDRINISYGKQEISPAKYKQDLESTHKFFNGIIEEFQNSGSRVKESNLEVVISCNAHDIAAMSTGRGWTSCMNLLHGAHNRDPFCEVKDGGFVAYIIRSDDKEIKRPIARIHIRRFSNKKGQSVAIPEETVYGTDVPGFRTVVKAWLKSKQGNIVPGNYRRTGGSYSDTFGSKSEKTILGPTTDDRDLIKKWIKRWLSLDENKRKQFNQYALVAIKSLLESTRKFPQPLIEKLAEGIFASDWRFMKVRVKLLLKYPEIATKERFETCFINSDSVNEREELIQAFPQFVNQELFDRVSDTQKAQFADKIPKENITAYIVNKLNVDNPNFAANSNRSTHQVQGDITDALNLAITLKQLPSPLIDHIIDFGKNVDKLRLQTNFGNVRQEHMADAARAGILKQIVHTFAMTHADTPNVQAFYKELLPRWYELGGIGEFGIALKNLKENGRQFLPFLYKRLQEIESVPETPRNSMVISQSLENHRYIIDAIENGTGTSNKYHYTWGVR